MKSNPVQARAYWCHGIGQGSINNQSLAATPNGHIRLRTSYSGISRGTEIKVAKGSVPPSEWERMRCPHQSGDFPFPVKYGYCNVARVEAGPKYLLNQFVFALFPHQDIFDLPTAQATPLPPALPPKRAILAANMETALNAVWDSGAAPGDRIIVIGAGTLGLLIARLLARVAGIDVTIFDIDPGKSSIAGRLALPFTTAVDEEFDADIVINASGSQAGLAAGLAMAGNQGLILEASWLDSNGGLPLGGPFHSRRLTIKSSQVGQLPPQRAPRWNFRRRMIKALELLAGDSLLDHLITHEIHFDELPQTMAKLCQGWRAPLTICVNYP